MGLKVRNMTEFLVSVPVTIGAADVLIMAVPFECTARCRLVSRDSGADAGAPLLKLTDGTNDLTTGVLAGHADAAGTAYVLVSNGVTIPQDGTITLDVVAGFTGGNVTLATANLVLTRSGPTNQL